MFHKLTALYRENREQGPHLQDVDKKIRDLRKMQRTLRNMVSECEGELLPECPIIESLFAS